MEKNQCTESLDVAVIGAGLAGLSAAVRLQEEGKTIRIFEASSKAGGRVATEILDGFQLDNGFHIMLTAYPECQRQLNYAALELHPFVSGALVWKDGSFKRVINPLTSLSEIPSSLSSGMLEIKDIFKILPIYTRLRLTSIDTIIQNSYGSAAQVLDQLGLSRTLTDAFLKPFFRGVLLNKDLSCPGHFINYALKMFLLGVSALPANGMQAIPKQLEDKLHPGTIRFQAKVKSIEPHLITLASGEKVAAKEILLACDQWSQNELLKASKTPPGQEVYCCYLAANQSPFGEGILVLNGEDTGVVNNLAVLSDVAPSYAPPGTALISATVLSQSLKGNTASLEQAVKAHLATWFGPQVKGWQHLKTYHIKNAHPSVYPIPTPNPQNPYQLKNGIWQCGDFLESPSMQSAMKTGREAAEAILRNI